MPVSTYSQSVTGLNINLVRLLNEQLKRKGILLCFLTALTHTYHMST